MLGAPTYSAKRQPAGGAHDMTAPVVGSKGGRAPKGRDVLPPSRQLIEHLRSTDGQAVMRLNGSTLPVVQVSR